MSGVDDQVVCAFRSPFSRGYMQMAVPRTLTMDQIESISKLARGLGVAIAGSDGIPISYAQLPINAVGRTALLVILHTMPITLTNGPEGDIVMGMIAASSLLRHILDRVANHIKMNRQEYIASVLCYHNKYGTRFDEALRLRVPGLIEQSKDISLSDSERSNRLVSLCNIALKAIEVAPEPTGEDDGTCPTGIHSQDPIEHATDSGSEEQEIPEDDAVSDEEVDPNDDDESEVDDSEEQETKK